MMKINILIVALMLLGCSEKNEQPNIVEDKTFEVVANADPNNSASRTTLSGTTLSWELGDQMGAFVDGIQSNRLFANTESNSFSGSFVVKNQTASDVNCSAYYPYIPQGINSSTTIKTSLPTKQVAPFDGSANFMTSVQQKINYSEEGSMPSINFLFNNQLFSIVKVSITNTNAALQNEKFIGVTLSAPKDVVLTGVFSFDMAQAIPAAVFTDDKDQLSNSVAVNYAAKDIKLGLNQEHVVYAIVKSSSNAVTLKLDVNTEQRFATVNTTTPVELKKGSVVILPQFEITELKPKPLKVLQYNVWSDAGWISKGPESVANVIAQIDADVIFFQEVRGQNFLNTVMNVLLEETGVQYYSEATSISTVVMSRYPLTEIQASNGNTGTGGTHDPEFFIDYDVGGYNSYHIQKAVITFAGQEIALYSLHLDYLNEGRRLPRDGITINEEEVLAHAANSTREYEIGIFLTDMRKEVAKGRLIIFGGDFNEPSHFDWTNETKDLFHHNGAIINWKISNLLAAAGCQDTYREKFTNVVTHPGFTWPVGSQTVGISESVPYGIDDRDRIDITYYHRDEKLKLVDVAIIGTKEDYINGVYSSTGIYLQETDDPIITPKDGRWPSDHKATFAKFELILD